MSSTPNLPSWLITARSSEKHISNVLRVLATRESKRDAARNASRRKVTDESESLNPTSARLPLASLVRRSKEVPSDHVDHYSVAAGSQDAHQDMNRYMDVTPYDRTRVVVHNGSVAHVAEDRNGSRGRYLNASWVLERAGHKWWIATQAPLRNTAHAFLSVMLQPIVMPPSFPASQSTVQKASRVKTIVQLTRNVESGRKKADAYFPSEVGRSVIIPPEAGYSAPALKVTLHESKTIQEAHCVESIVSIVPVFRPSSPVSESRRTVDTSESGEGSFDQVSDDNKVVFKHMLYSSWPDHGVPDPEDRDSLFAFIRLVDQNNRDTSNSVYASFPTNPATAGLNPDPPIMVGCSAGIGRTGSFIALSSIMREYGLLPSAAQPTPSSVLPVSPLGPLPDTLINDLVAQEIDSLREQRPGMVQRPEQALLVYEALADALTLKA